MKQIIIQVNAEGQRLIGNVCDSALKQAGLNAFNDVSTILGNVRLVAPPQDKPEPEEKPEEKDKKEE